VPSLVGNSEMIAPVSITWPREALAASSRGASAVTFTVSLASPTSTGSAKPPCRQSGPDPLCTNVGNR